MRCLLVDDNTVFLETARSLLIRDGVTVAGTASCSAEAVRQADELRPDIAIVDYALPIINGIEVTRQIRARVPTSEVLMFTMHDSDALIGEVLQAGARAFLLKSDAQHYLMSAIESLSVHKPFFTGKLSEKLLETFLSTQGHSPGSTLSPRERIVVQLIAEGNSNKDMSSVLNVSIKTIETHRAAAMRKLNLTSTAALIRYAIRNKLVEP